MRDAQQPMAPQSRDLTKSQPVPSGSTAKEGSELPPPSSERPANPSVAGGLVPNKPFTTWERDAVHMDLRLRQVLVTRSGCLEVCAHLVNGAIATCREHHCHALGHRLRRRSSAHGVARMACIVQHSMPGPANSPARPTPLPGQAAG